MPFQMPPIEVGDMVLYFADGSRSSQPTPAVVTKAGRANISLSVFDEHRTQFRVPTGVMHVDDPRIANAYNDSGAWDYTPAAKRLSEAMQFLKMLEDEKFPAKVKKSA